MIKIEKLFDDCDAKVGVDLLHEGRLLSHYDFNRITMTKGYLMYTINESEIKYKNKDGDFNLNEEEPQIEKEPEVQEPLTGNSAKSTTVPNLPKNDDSAKSTTVPNLPKNDDSAKSTQKDNSAKSNQNLDNEVSLD